MKDFINEIIDNFENSNDNDNDNVNVNDNDDNVEDVIESLNELKELKNPQKKKSLRQYWVEILLCLVCFGYLYYISSSIYNYTIFGISLGRFVTQVLVFILPFIGLWLFYRVNKTRKVESKIQINSSSTDSKESYLIAIKQNGRCASCNKILDKNYLIEPFKKDLRAVCNTCYDRNCLNNSLYKTIRDF
jgi:hypothetical protein